MQFWPTCNFCGAERMLPDGTCGACGYPACATCQGWRRIDAIVNGKPGSIDCPTCDDDTLASASACAKMVTP